MTPCTRCRKHRPIAFRGTFDGGLPYQLCAPCYRIYQTLDAQGAAGFAIDLWQRSAVQHLPAEGTA